MKNQSWLERRESERVPAAELPHLSARLDGNREVRLIDVSRRGVQFETTIRLRPGTEVTLRLLAGGEHVTLTGEVVRSLVSALDGTELVYRTALSFPEDIAFYGRPAPPGPAAHAAGPAAADAAPPGPGETPIVFHVTNTDLDGRLCELLSANDW